MNIREIVIGSGGARGIVALGTLHELQTQGLLDKVTTFHGTSVGALLCAGLVLGRSSEVMLQRIIKYPLRCDPSTATGFGIDSGKSLVTCIRKVLRIRNNLTLSDVYKQTRKTLYICVCNVSLQKVEYWSHTTHPDVSLLRALRCSCSIPVLFKPVVHQGHLYVDGAVGRHTPPADHPERALTIHFMSKPAAITSWPSYFAALSNVHDGAKTRFVISLESDIDPLSFEFTPEEAQRYFALGQERALQFIKKNM